MARTLNLIFTKLDGAGRKTVKIPEPPANIDTQAATIESNMTTYVEGNVMNYPVFDEAHVVDTTSTELINIVE